MVDAREYHERTNHSLAGLRRESFRPDPQTMPRPFKVYGDLPREPLPGVFPPNAPALSAAAESNVDPLADTDQPAESDLDRETLATLCYEASGVVSEVERDGRTVRYRAASCTGKLYHVDSYLICGDLPDLDAGVYHFDPDGFAFDVLRRGDYRSVLAAAAGPTEGGVSEDATTTEAGGIADAPVTVVATSTWWRNAWKYRERTYRHAFWDAGTVLANLLATAHALGRRASIVSAYADDPVVKLLGIDPTEEAPIALAPIGSDDPAVASNSSDSATIDPISPETVPYSSATEDYPLVVDAWRQSRLDADAVAAWRRAIPDSLGHRDGGDGDRVPLDPVDHETASARPLSNVVRRRGSCREYADDRRTSRRQLGTILDRATRGVPADWNDGDADGLQFNDVYVLARQVEGVPEGTYQFHPDTAELERLGPNDAGTQTRLALGQEWAGDAHANVYCLSDVDSVVDALGDRGYRLAQLEAGITLGRLYLATFAHRDLGGTGLTFDDDEVATHFQPRAAGQQPTTLFALGVAD